MYLSPHSYVYLSLLMVYQVKADPMLLSHFRVTLENLEDPEREELLDHR